MNSDNEVHQLTFMPNIPLNRINDCGVCYTIHISKDYETKAGDLILHTKYINSENECVRLETFERIELYSKHNELMSVLNYPIMKCEYQNEKGNIKFSDLFTLPTWLWLKDGMIKLYRNCRIYKAEELYVFTDSCRENVKIGGFKTRDFIQKANRQNTIELNGEIIDFRCFKHDRHTEHNEYYYKSIHVKKCLINGKNTDKIINGKVDVLDNMLYMINRVKYSYVEQLYFEFDDDFEKPEDYEFYIVLRILD